MDMENNNQLAERNKARQKVDVMNNNSRGSKAVSETGPE